MPARRVVVIVGTPAGGDQDCAGGARPAPGARAETVLLSTGQHRELLDSALAPFGLVPDHELAVMAEGQTPNQVIERVVHRLPPLLARLEPAAVLVQGDTAVDSLLWMLELHRLSPADARPELLITLHRRESFGGALRQILLGIRDFLAATPGAAALWPVHPNPTVRRTAAEVFASDDRIRLLEPLGFAEFAALLARARVILTDSGGIQEEAPALGKAVLVARETTERPEGLETGNRLIGRRREDVRAALESAWATSTVPERWPVPNPFGDGRAGERIVEILMRDLGRRGG